MRTWPCERRPRLAAAAWTAAAAVRVELCFEIADRKPDARTGASEVVERPAVSQQERDNDQPWVLAGGQARGGTDELIELVGDVEFFEENVEEPTSPGDAL